MEVDEVSCILIVTSQEPRKLGFWSCLLLRGKNKVRTIIITAYFPTLSASSGVAYRQPLEALNIMRIQNDPRTSFRIYIKTEISKWIHQGETIILMGDWNSEALEVNTWMGIQGLANTICNLHGY